MFFDGLLHYCQSQSCASFLSRVVWLKHLCDVLSRDAATCVGNFHLGALVGFIGRNLHDDATTFTIHCLQAVQHQVGQDGSDCQPVSHDFGNCAFLLNASLDSMFCGLHFDHLQCVFNFGSEI